MTESTLEELMEALPVLRRLRSMCQATGDEEGWNALVLAHRVVLEKAAELEREKEGADAAKSTG